MARSRSRVPARRSGGRNRTADKLRARISGAARKRAAERKSRQEAMATLAGGAALAWIQNQGWQNPWDIPGIPDAAVYGGALYLVGDNFVSGNMGQWIRGAGLGMATVAIHEMILD